MTADRDRRDAAVGGWLAQHGGGPALALCADAPQPATEGRLAVRFDTCLGQVAPHRLVDLALAAGHPLLLTGPCAPECPAPASLHPLCALVGPGVLAAATAGDGVPGPTLDVTRPPVSRRGLPGANTKPTASTPSSPARRTSPGRVMPQNLIRVR